MTGKASFPGSAGGMGAWGQQGGTRDSHLQEQGGLGRGPGALTPGKPVSLEAEGLEERLRRRGPEGGCEVCPFAGAFHSHGALPAHLGSAPPSAGDPQ